jgi:type I site-specific restriction-modification system R (restriction) subunit
MKRSDNSAGNQIRLFLGELKNATHVAKMKAIQQFQTYLKTYQPNVFFFSFLRFFCD